MPTDDSSQKLEDLKLSVLSLLCDLWKGGQVGFALANDAPFCDFDRVLDVLTEGGEVGIGFAGPSHRITIHDMKRFLKSCERGAITIEELIERIWNESNEILDCLEDHSDTRRQRLLAEEMRRALEPIEEISDDLRKPWGKNEEDTLDLPYWLKFHRCSCMVSFIESLFSTNTKDDMMLQRAQLASLLAMATHTEGLLLSDASHQEIFPREVKAVVLRGGTLWIAALSPADMLSLSSMQRLIDEWYNDRLSSRTLCRRLKSYLNKVEVVDPDWWDMFHSRLSDLWIVAFGKFPKKSRVSTIEREMRDDVRTLLDDIERLVCAYYLSS